ncbi:hypothetical protein [Enterobacter hormaechei]|uniref:hypothetical protein n=1 Tax=Enterobacter hormaechei TaxID=158836 RepID=UPI0034D2E608
MQVDDLAGTEGSAAGSESGAVTLPGGESGATRGSADPGTAGGDGSGSVTLPGGEGGEDNGTGGESTAALMFGDEPLPDFVPPEETPREKELRLELEELKRTTAAGAQRPQPLTAEPLKPDRLSFETDEEYEAAFERYVEDKRRWKDQVAKQEERSLAHKQQFNEAVNHYSKGRESVAVNLKDFAAVEKYADDNLDPNIVAAILFGGKDGTFSNPQNMIYAIGRQPELLKQLNAMDNPILAGAKLLEISQKSQFAPKVPGNPGNSIPAAGGGGVTDLAAELAAAEREAEQTGDRTKVHEIKARQREAAQKK